MKRFTALIAGMTILFAIGAESASAYGMVPNYFWQPRHEWFWRPARRSIQDHAYDRHEVITDWRLRRQYRWASQFPGTHAPTGSIFPMENESDDANNYLPFDFDINQVDRNRLWEYIRYEGPPKRLKQKGFQMRMDQLGY
jgi:hypothetical protein